MSTLLRFVTALLPLALVPPLTWMVASGYIDIGGGEKDIVWILPWFIWSVIFAASCFTLWLRGWTHGRALRRSSLVAVAGVLGVAVILFFSGLLGVGGF